MARGLDGKRIVITGSRKLSELSAIIEKHDGIPVVRPQQGTLLLAENEVERDLLNLVESGTDWMIFTTGTGLEALLQQAERIGVTQSLLTVVKQSKVAARGYKTFAMLKKSGSSRLSLMMMAQRKDLFENCNPTHLKVKG